jgi:predicted TIM-barrel fold metal-dependent hydrolase
MWRGSEWFMGCCGLAFPDNAYSAAGTQTKLHGIYTRTIAAQIAGFNRSQLKIVLGHMGEGLPFWRQPIDNRCLLEVKIGAVDKLPQPPRQYFLDYFVITTAGASASCSPPTFLMRMTPGPCASWTARP